MKDEIKEKIKAYYMDNDIDEVLDYITNLQEELEEQKRIEQADFKIIQNLEEENERLIILKEKYQLKKEVYKLRNEKAIEYIEKLKNFKIKYVMSEEKELYASEKDFVKDLLNILNGDEE